MKITEIRDEIFAMQRRLNVISELISKDGVEKDGVCFQYLSDKFIGLKNTVAHIIRQCDFKHDPIIAERAISIINSDTINPNDLWEFADEIEKLKIEHQDIQGDDFYSCLFLKSEGRKECDCGTKEHNEEVDRLVQRIKVIAG